MFSQLVFRFSLVSYQSVTQSSRRPLWRQRKSCNRARKPALLLLKNHDKNQGRELLPECQTSQAPQDAHWRQGRTRPGRENHRGGGISEGGGRDYNWESAARSAVVWCVSGDFVF
jgi:hypothetical protein